MGNNKLIEEMNKLKRKTDGTLRQRYEGNLNFLSLIDLIYALLDVLWGESWGTFTMEKPKTLDAKDVEFPIIVAQLQKFSPGKVGENTHERKPRLRNTKELINDAGEKMIVRDYGQRMDAEVTFSVFAENNKEAIEISHSLMEIIDKYKGLLNKFGIQNIWFKEEEALEVNSREYIIARKITYHTTFERIYRENPNNIEEVSVEAESVLDKLRRKEKLPSQQ